MRSQPCWVPQRRQNRALAESDSPQLTHGCTPPMTLGLALGSDGGDLARRFGPERFHAAARCGRTPEERQTVRRRRARPLRLRGPLWFGAGRDRVGRCARRSSGLDAGDLIGGRRFGGDDLPRRLEHEVVARLALRGSGRGCRRRQRRQQLRRLLPRRLWLVQRPPRPPAGPWPARLRLRPLPGPGPRTLRQRRLPGPWAAAGLFRASDGPRPVPAAAASSARCGRGLGRFLCPDLAAAARLLGPCPFGGGFGSLAWRRSSARPRLSSASAWATAASAAAAIAAPAAAARARSYAASSASMSSPGRKRWSRSVVLAAAAATRSVASVSVAGAVVGSSTSACATTGASSMASSMASTAASSIGAASTGPETASRRAAASIASWNELGPSPASSCSRMRSDVGQAIGSGSGQAIGSAGAGA